MNDPLTIWRTRIRLTMILGSIALVACATWAFSPLARTTPPPLPIELEPSPSTDPTTNNPPFATDAFSVKLWPNTNPSPVSPPLTPLNPTAPLHLQLISIIREDEGLRAALYDSQRNKLVLVQSGDRLPPYAISVITETTVELNRGTTTHLLKLREVSP